MALANWWRVARGIDPAAHLRGTYDDEKSCDRVIREAGGVLAIVQGIADRVGAPETEAPGPGDFAVVEFLDRQWGAIMTPAGRWAVKIGEGRFAALRTCKVLRAWQV